MHGAHDLVGGTVDLIDNAVFEGRNVVIASDTAEPIYPFHVAVATDAVEIRRKRSPVDMSYLMHPLILQHQITPKTSRYTRCSMSMLPNVSINGRIRSSGQLGRWWYSISPCRNSECVRRFTVFAFNQRS